MAVDLSELEAFKKTLSDMDLKPVREELLIGLANRVVARATDYTPVDTGYLKGRWFISGPNNLYDTTRVLVGNNTEYVEYVEYGHRKANSTEFIKGNFMLTDASKEVGERADRIVANDIKAYLQKRLNT